VCGVRNVRARVRACVRTGGGGVDVTCAGVSRLYRQSGHAQAALEVLRSMRTRVHKGVS
jgi:hypothetical protein